MGQKQIKKYRKVGGKAAKRYYHKAIDEYVFGLCKEKFGYRFRFCWLVLFRINPHTMKKVKK